MGTGADMWEQSPRFTKLLRNQAAIEIRLHEGCIYNWSCIGHFGKVKKKSKLC